MKLAVIGSRGIDDAAFVWAELDRLASEIQPSEIISGGAVGVDTIAEQWARARGLPVRVFRPRYQDYPPSRRREAPLARNLEIVAACDAVASFWDGSSRGTAYTVKNARNQGKRIFELWNAEAP